MNSESEIGLKSRLKWREFSSISLKSFITGYLLFITLSEINY